MRRVTIKGAPRPTVQTAWPAPPALARMMRMRMGSGCAGESGKPAVHPHHLCVGPAAFRPGQKGHHGGDLFRRAQPLQRGRLADGGDLLFRLAVLEQVYATGPGATALTVMRRPRSRGARTGAKKVMTLQEHPAKGTWAARAHRHGNLGALEHGRESCRKPPGKNRYGARDAGRGGPGCAPPRRNPPPPRPPATGIPRRGPTWCRWCRCRPPAGCACRARRDAR